RFCARLESGAAFRTMDPATHVQHELSANRALQARPSHEREELLVERAVQLHDLAHRRVLNTPVTLPRICTWSGYNGDRAEFSGWRRMRPFSRKKRLTVASSADSSSPASATTMSPSRAACWRWTTT